MATSCGTDLPSLGIAPQKKRIGTKQEKEDTITSRKLPI